MKAAVLYARVSTDQQDPEMQRRESLAYIERRGWKLAGEFVDHGECGAKESRPQLDEMMKRARRRLFDVIVVWKFDRFARTLRQLVFALDEFRELGIEFVSVTEAIDTTTTIGRAMFGVAAVFAEFERENIRERVRSGIAKRKAQGLPVGRARTWTDEQAARAHQLRAQGVSWRKLAREVGLPVTTVRAAVRQTTSRTAS